MNLKLSLSSVDIKWVKGGDFHKVVAAILNLKLSLSSQKEHISLTETKGLAQYCTLHFCGKY